jgi:hypothetical protein
MNLENLLNAAKKVVLTEEEKESQRQSLANSLLGDEEKEKQRRSFAYGNTKIENPRITRETVDREAESLGAPKNERGTRSA